MLIDVHAASVNGADWKVRSGQHAVITDVPYIPGRDFSGVVSALGHGVIQKSGIGCRKIDLVAARDEGSRPLSE